MNEDFYNKKVKTMFREYLQDVEKCEVGSSEWGLCWQILNAIKDYLEREKDE